MRIILLSLDRAYNQAGEDLICTISSGLPSAKSAGAFVCPCGFSNSEISLIDRGERHLAKTLHLERQGAVRVVEGRYSVGLTDASPALGGTPNPLLPMCITDSFLVYRMVYANKHRNR
jgi:hypothetical protein